MVNQNRKQPWKLHSELKVKGGNSKLVPQKFGGPGWASLIRGCFRVIRGGNLHVEDFSIVKFFPAKRGFANLGVLLILTRH